MQNHNKNITAKAFGLLLFVALIVTVFPSLSNSAEIKQNITDALNKGDTTRAIQFLEEQIQSDPSFELNYYTLGMIYVEREQYEKAEGFFLIAIEKDKKFWPGQYQLGLVELKLNKIDSAEERFKTGIKKSKKLKAYFHSGMARVLMAREMYSEADGEIRKALVIDDSEPIFHIILGTVYVKSKVYSLAISSFEKALNLDTLSMDIYYDWSEACIEMKDFQCALEKLSIVLGKDSTYAPAWMKAGGIYYKAARSSRNRDEIKDLYSKTIAAYEKYIELSQSVPDSSNGRAFYEAGMAYLKLNYFAESRDYFDKVLSIPVVPKDIYFNYGKSWYGVSRLKQREGAKADTIPEYDSALVYFNKHIDWVQEMKAEGEYVSSINDDELYRKIGECYEAKKDRFNTISYYKKSLEYNPNQDRLVYGVAVAYNYTQDYRNALIYYKKRIEMGLDERYWSIYYNAATSALYLTEKGPGAMEEEEDLGLDDDGFDEPEDPAADELAGVDLLDLAIGYLEKVAIDHWDFVMSNERNKPLAIKALGMLGSAYLYQKSDCASGQKYYEKVLEIEPENCEAMKSIGYAYFGGICNQNYSRALNYLHKALNCYGAKGDAKCKDIEMLIWIAQSYEFRAIEKLDAGDKEGKKVDYKKAFDWYEEILKCDPTNTEGLEGRRRTKWEF